MPITLNGDTGITTPGLTNTGSTTLVSLTTTGNTILGDQSTDTLNVANGNLVLNSSGNLGIGTASPSARLHAAVDGAGESDIARFSRTNGADLHFLDIGVNADTNFVIFDSSGSAAGGYTFRRGGTDAMTLSAGGVLTVTENAVIQGLTVGRGVGAVATNTAVGAAALGSNTSGSYNVALGSGAGQANTTGIQSTFVGGLAGGQNTTGSITAVGYAALYGNTTGTNNVAVGNNNGTGTAAPLQTNTTGSQNTAVGHGALGLNTTASNNTAVGYQAGYSNTTGSQLTALGYQAAYTAATATNITAIGYQAAQSATGDATVAVGTSAAFASTGVDNTAMGAAALLTNGSGANNTAIGRSALRFNTTASNNTAVGHQSTYNNTTGADNSALGISSLYTNTTGSSNSAVGNAALYLNTTGSQNTAIGQQALRGNTTASYNTAVGYQTLYSNTTGTENTAIGRVAGYSNTTGSYNAFLGHDSGYFTTSSNNTFVGHLAGYYVTTGAKNTILGRFHGNQGGLDIRTASNRIVLSDGDGNPRGIFDESGLFIVTGGGTTTSQAGTATIYNNTANQNALNVISLNTAGSQYILNLQSNASIANTAFLIRGYSDTSTGVFFVAGNGNVTNANNSYGAISDAKLKENIVDASPKLAGLMQVKVRNYNLIGNTTKQLGVVAQELETVFPAMVEETKDVDKDLNDLGTITKTVKYSVFVPMLIKAMQEQQAIIESLKARLDAANL